MWKSLVSIIALTAAVSGAAHAGSALVIDTFTPEGEESALPKGWQKAWFGFCPRHTDYTVVKDDGNWVLKAESVNAASSIYKEVSIDPRLHQILTWRWKVSNVLKHGDETRKEGDDYAARLYVLFEYRPVKVSAFEIIERRVIKTVYGKELPGEALIYVWANKLQKNKSVPNPDTDKAMMVAVESGPDKAGVWLLEERNIYEDYKRLFGKEPPLITHIAIMTDTDNTDEAVTAYYDDIIFHKTMAGAVP
ncbi:MAG: DUF3047 domain-containing protein [Deltaproteobacteria bacterium]|nr:DUF3047 domain-containing protein [Deltaproteobacteria bacterium]